MPLKSDHGRPRPRGRGPAVLPLLLLVLCLGTEAVAAQNWERLPVRRWDWDQVTATTGGRGLLDAELRRQGESVRRWSAVHELLGSRQVSAKSQRLLAARGLGPAKLAAGADDPDKAFDGIDTLRVLLVRIAFDGNRAPSLTTVPADGNFMLAPLADPGPLEVDPPPHDKGYFRSHLQGLSEYYRFMSGRRLHIEGRVLPEGDQDAYRVGDLADYGPGAGRSWTIDGLERLVRDMITATDAGTRADGSVNLADYDDSDPFTYVIFVHAGSDWQSDINGDSPNDVPTFFVNLGDPQSLTSVGSDGSPGALTECSVIPETTNQDGYAGSIAAAFYHEFGHALGLVDVYDTSRGLPTAGIWDLMDSGTNLSATLGAVTDQGDTVFVAAGGVLPPSLSAWDKWFLGWIETGEIDGSRAEYHLPAVGVPREDYADWQANGYGAFSLSDPQAWRGGLSPREWFLIENRWVPVGTEPLPYDGLAFERNDTTGVIMYLAGLRAGTEDQWENSGLYDYFLPAGGLLVWHVNGDRIESGLAGNTINTDGNGLRLVEADGIQDIGILDSYVLGWFGSWRDPFGGRDLNGNATGFNALPADGFPNSRMFDRSWSHLALSGIGQRGVRTASVMKFQATIGGVPAGLPWQIAEETAVEAEAAGGSAGPRAIDTATLTPFETGGFRLLLFADAPGENHGDGAFDGTLYALTSDGREYWPRTPGRQEGAIAALGGRASGAPVLLPAPANQSDVIVALREGTVRAVRLGGSGVADQWQIVVADSLRGGPVPLRGADGTTRLSVLAPPNSLFLLGADGTVIGPALTLTDALAAPVDVQELHNLPAPTASPDRLCAVSANGWHLVSAGTGGWSGAPIWTPFARTSSGPLRAAAVPTEDGALFHVFDDLGSLGSWRVADDVVTALDRLPAVSGPLVCEPAVADLDGDGQHDLIVATAERIVGLKAEGIPLRGWPRRLSELFPLADTTRVAGPLVVCDATADGQNEVFFNTDGGHLVGLGPEGRLLEQLPLRWGDRRTAGLAVGDGTAGRMLWLVSGGGYTAPPLNRTWVSGRVSGWQLAAPNAGAGTSEWLGAGGGTSRRGPTGTARDLGDVAPAAADRGEVVLFPNPVGGEAVNARFYTEGNGPARLAVYNLQGELVRESRYAVDAGRVNQVRLELPGIASGMYVTILEYDGPAGRQTRKLTLAVER